MDGPCQVKPQTHSSLQVRDRTEWCRIYPQILRNAKTPTLSGREGIRCLSLHCFHTVFLQNWERWCFLFVCFVWLVALASLNVWLGSSESLTLNFTSWCFDAAFLPLTATEESLSYDMMMFWTCFVINKSVGVFVCADADRVIVCTFVPSAA